MNIHYENYHTVTDLDGILSAFGMTQFQLKDLIVKEFEILPDQLEDYDFSTSDDRYMRMLSELVLDLDISISDVIYRITNKDKENLYTIWDHSGEDESTYDIGVISISELYKQILANLDRNDIEIQIQLTLRGLNEQVQL